MALIPPFFLDCVAAIGRQGTDSSISWIASGFLYGELEGTTPEGQNSYRMYVVTNRHVLVDERAIVLRFSSEETALAPAINLPIVDASGNPSYRLHPDPDVDVAVLPIDVSLLRIPGTKFSFFQSDHHTIDRADAVASGMSEGDAAFVLGFPMGQVGGDRNYVIVRQGALARVRDWLSGAAKEFLVDATVFPGNSGGPVVTAPELVSITGTNPVQAANLIGMVKSYVPYTDVAVSRQTGRVRISFEENSGLAAVVPFDFIREAVRLHRDSVVGPTPSVNTSGAPPDDKGPAITSTTMS